MPTADRPAPAPLATASVPETENAARPAQAQPPAPAARPALAALPEMTAILQTLSRPAAEAPADQPSARLAAPLPPAAQAADSDAGDITVAYRPDMQVPMVEKPDWVFQEPKPRRLEGDGDGALIAEADLSALGLFRLETRPAHGGFAVVIRHRAPMIEDRLETLGQAVMAEAERYGVRARIRFVHDPALIATT